MAARYSPVSRHRGITCSCANSFRVALAEQPLRQRGVQRHPASAPAVGRGCRGLGGLCLRTSALSAHQALSRTKWWRNARYGCARIVRGAARLCLTQCHLERVLSARRGSLLRWASILQNRQIMTHTLSTTTPQIRVWSTQTQHGPLRQKSDKQA